MRSVLTALAACATLTGCASTCPPPPDPPVWALATVPDEATFEQREAWGDSLLALLAQCRR